MTTPDWVPAVSQIKSLVQLGCLDVKGARETQYNFFTQCPIVAHVLGALILPFHEGMGRTAIKGGFVTLCDILDATPGTGYIMAVVYLMLCNRKRAKKAIVASCRTSIIALIGIVGYIIGDFVEALSIVGGGPVISYISAFTAGLLFDGLKSTAFPKDKEGVWVLCDHRRPGDWFDAIYTLVEDGFSGYGAGAIAVEFIIGDLLPFPTASP